MSNNKTLFVIRGKLGDTIAAWPSISAYIHRHPRDNIYLAVRKSYYPLLAREKGIKFVPFANSLELFLKIILLRIKGRFDKLAVVWGFGKQIPRIAYLSGAKFRAYLDSRFGDSFNAIASQHPNDFISDAAWRVTRLLDDGVARPRFLSIKNLARDATPESGRDLVCIAPVADEARRTMDRPTTIKLISAAKKRFPNHTICLIGNLRDQAFIQLQSLKTTESVIVKLFPTLNDLIQILGRCHHLCTVDTGVYHLAASMGIPSTIFFGPTQPEKVVLPDQDAIERVRLPHLQNAHCEVKSCLTPYCLYSAISLWSSQTSNIPNKKELPIGCIL